MNNLKEIILYALLFQPFFSAIQDNACELKVQSSVKYSLSYGLWFICWHLY